MGNTCMSLTAVPVCLSLLAILPLLAAGLLAGPLVTNILHPQEQLGHLFFPFVSLSVAVILFEGALTLDWRELRTIAGVVRNLLTIGAPLEAFPSGDDERDALTINQATEQLIRQNPEQYLWIHKRYKRRPDGSFGIYPPWA